MIISGHQALLGGQAVSDHASAVSLLAGVDDWFGFADTGASSTGTGNTIINVYSGGLTYFTGGIGGGKYAKGTQENRANGITWSSGQSLAFGFWLYLDEAADSNTSFGLGHASTGTDPYGCVAVARSGGATTISIIAYDFGVAALVGGASYTITGNPRVFCSLEYNGSTKKFDLYVGDNVNAPVSASTLTFVGTPDPSYNWGAICWRNNGGSAFNPIPHGVDEFYLAGNFAMTAAIRSYLWNGGAGKTYAQLVADAA